MRELRSHPWVCVLQWPPLCALCKGQKVQATPKCFSQLWERQQNVANPSYRRTELSSRTLQGNYSPRKGGQRNGLQVLLLHLSPSQGSPKVKAEPKKAAGSALPLGHRTKVGLSHFCTPTTSLKSGFKSLLYPHNFPEHYGPTTSTCWRVSGWLQASGEDGMEVIPAGKRKLNAQIQCWAVRNPCWQQMDSNLGSTAGTDLAFTNCIVVPTGWQTCPKNKWNCKASQPVWTLPC